MCVGKDRKLFQKSDLAVLKSLNSAIVFKLPRSRVHGKCTEFAFRENRTTKEQNLISTCRPGGFGNSKHKNQGVCVGCVRQTVNK